MDNFWQTKTLEQMDSIEWEALCDGCAKCCLVKLEDHESAEIFHTNVTCELLDIDSCQCSNYSGRHSVVNDCIALDQNNIHALSWLPKSCSYRLIADGQPLPDWHYLISGSKQTIHAYGASLQGWVVSELDVRDDDIQDHVIRWVD
ncbi:MAG: YcgN family cysteine cluster protein [Porticoccaceae bacterium]|nr:YcgN family cysteine cluster protein [Porticoccaceae bacterium]|tara:strand:- start:308 stop:745 length:438 start_codon:yes stop_codon:yes gene_type:complete